MSLKIESFKIEEVDKFESVRKIRETVFVIEQQVAEEEEFDEFEEDSTHYLMRFRGKPIGTARWRTIGNKVKLERFAVLKEFRGNQFGDALLEKVIADASQLKKPIYLHAQLKAIPFYLQSFASSPQNGRPKP
jgi:predicted GNAT family N-acyltransferase